MKKRLIFLAIVFFILSSILVSAENQTNTSQNATQLTSNPSQNSTQVIITIQDKTNALLSQEPVIPEELKGLLRVLFGLEKDEAIPFQNFIIFTALWIMLFLLLQNALEFLPFFGKGPKSWIGALVISCLASTTGAINIVAHAFFFIEKDIKFLTAWSIITIILNLVIFAAFFFGIRELLKNLKKEAELMQLKRAGLNTGISSALNQP